MLLESRVDLRSDMLHVQAVNQVTDAEAHAAGVECHGVDEEDDGELEHIRGEGDVVLDHLPGNQRWRFLRR